MDFPRGRLNNQYILTSRVMLSFDDGPGSDPSASTLDNDLWVLDIVFGVVSVSPMYNLVSLYLENILGFWTSYIFAALDTLRNDSKK